MTYQPNTQTVLVSERVDVSDIRTVCLAEFGEGPPIREVLMDPTSSAEEKVRKADRVCGKCANWESSFHPGCPCPEGKIVHKSAIGCENFSVHPPGFKPTDTPKNPLATASGLRLHSVHAPDGTVLASYDAESDRTSLDFLKDGSRIVASARPGKPYSWQIVELGMPSQDGSVAPITGTRLATAEESKILDEMYPGWLAACEKFDKDHASMERAKGVVQAPILPST